MNFEKEIKQREKEFEFYLKFTKEKMIILVEDSLGIWQP